MFLFELLYYTLDIGDFKLNVRNIDSHRPIRSGNSDLNLNVGGFDGHNYIFTQSTEEAVLCL